MLEESLMFEIIYACVKYKKKVKIKLFVKICLMCVNILPILHVYSKIIRSIKIYLTQPPAPSCQQQKKILTLPTPLVRNQKLADSPALGG